MRNAEAEALPRQMEREAPTRKSTQKFKKIGAIQDEYLRNTNERQEPAQPQTQQYIAARTATNNSYDTSSLTRQQD